MVADDADARGAEAVRPGPGLPPPEASPPGPGGGDLCPEARLVARRARPAGTVIEVRGVRVGGREVVVIAGPCAVESEEQLMATARAVKAGGASILRGGAFKPRTSPYRFRGLEQEGLRLLALAREDTGLPVVTEVMDARQLPAVAACADILQVGSRNMQNFTLLEEVGRCRIPVLLKRGMSATLAEYLLAAEYIVAAGNDQVILCERGIRTFEPSTRNTLDLNAVPLLQRETHLPVLVDPSHGTGRAWMVPALSCAAVAAGADGLLVEVHCDPARAMSDGANSLAPDAFARMVGQVAQVATAVGRSVRLAPDAAPAPVWV
jgi:3-deoxy-7-phosphoheptulonate synthase